jgi:hypothetical protein
MLALRLRVAVESQNVSSERRDAETPFALLLRVQSVYHAISRDCIWDNSASHGIGLHNP